MQWVQWATLPAEDRPLDVYATAEAEDGHQLEARAYHLEGGIQELHVTCTPPAGRDARPPTLLELRDAVHCATAAGTMMSLPAFLSIQDPPEDGPAPSWRVQLFQVGAAPNSAAALMLRPSPIHQPNGRGLGLVQ